MDFWFSEVKVGPDSLFDLCVDRIVRGLVNNNSSQWQVLKYAALPSKIGDAVMEWYLKEHGILDSKIFEVFGYSSSASLKVLNATNCKIENIQCVISLLRFELRCLHLEKCSVSTRGFENFLHALNENGINLEVFSCDQRMTEIIFSHAFEEIDHGIYAFESWEHILLTPNLKKLTVKDLNHRSISHFITKLLKPLKMLMHLDLSRATGNAIDCSFLLELPYLQSLVLQGTHLDCNSFTSINKLYQLQLLDLSFLPNGVDVPLDTLMKTLTNLKFFDVSQSLIVEDNLYNLKEVLQCRINNPFQFFGCYSDFPVDFASNIPAKIVSVYSNRKTDYSFLNAMWRNVDNPHELSMIVHYSLSDYSQEKTHLLQNLTVGIIELACAILDKTPSGSSPFHFAYQICVIALYNSEFYDFMTIQMKQGIVRLFIRLFKRSMLMGCSYYPIICDILKTKDWLSYLDMVMDLLEFIIHNVSECNLVPFDDEDESTGPIFVVERFLDQMNDDQRQRLINRGLIQDVLILIHESRRSVSTIDFACKCFLQLFDSNIILENNIEIFLHNGGISLLMVSLKMYRESGVLLWSFLSLLLRLAKYKSIAWYLIKEGNSLITLFKLINDDCVSAFIQSGDLMKYKFLICGIFTQILSHGFQIWTLEAIKIESVLNSLMLTIENFKNDINWELDTGLIKSVLPLLNVKHSPVIQYWAIQSIPQFCASGQRTFCCSLQKEEILEIERISAANDCPESVQKAASFIIRKVDLWSRPCYRSD